MRPSPGTAIVAILTLLVAGGPGPARADEVGAADGRTPPAIPDSIPPPSSPSGSALRPRLTVDLSFHLAATGGMLLASGVTLLLTDRLAAPACRWCEPNRLDRWARGELRWTDEKTAGTLSNVLVYVIPIGAALALGLSARADGAGAREVEEDLLVVTEAVSVATLLTQAAKLSTGRLRPDAWASGGGTTADSRMSFWGGHSMLAFSVAGAATQVARLRGRKGWGWLALASFAGAAATAWLRVGADRHWLTDVLAGAGVGTAAGLGVPLLVFHPAGVRASAVTLAPAPGGLALRF
jgi:hypothetical protein